MITGEIVGLLLQLGIVTVQGIFDARKKNPGQVAAELTDAEFEAKFANFDATLHAVSGNVAGRIDEANKGQ